MKKQLEHQLKELEDSDVIEKVQGPTSWVSPQMANIEDIIQQMNGSSVFS